VRRTILTSSSFSRLVIMALAGALAAMLAVVAFAPTTAVATHTSTHMRTPFDVGETWKVIWGYSQGGCHQNPSPCGGDEYYALDLVPVNDATGNIINAGGRDIYSPVRGTVVSKFNIEGGSAGQGIKIKTEDGGHLVHLYHLMNVRVSPRDTVTADTLVGQVFNQYGGPEGPRNHLHIQLSNLQGVSQPIKLAGREYYSGPTWKSALIRENVLFANPNYGNPHWWFVEDVSDMRNATLGNDVASSLRVNQGCQVTLYEHINYTGRSRSFTDNVPNLATHGFDNITSSVKLSCPTGG
jgi:peptidase M23-like protein/peptidase inhibitor family I36